MTVIVNGTPRELPDQSTITDLLRQLELDRDGIAVAVDLHVVPRTQHPHTALQEGSKIEVIRAVGGG